MVFCIFTSAYRGTVDIIAQMRAIAMPVNSLIVSPDTIIKQYVRINYSLVYFKRHMFLRLYTDIVH